MLATVSGQELFSLGGETEEGKGGGCTCPSVQWVHSPSGIAGCWRLH